MGYKTFTDGPILSQADLNLLMKQTVATFANTTERANSIPTPVPGQLSYVTGIGLQQYIPAISPNPAQWRTIFPDQTWAKYSSPAMTQVFPSATWRRVNLTNVLQSSGAWTPGTVGTGTDQGSYFTCTVAGRYAITGFFRMNQGAPGHRAISLANNASQAGDVCAYAGYYQGGTDYWAMTIYGERSFLAGDTLAMWVWQTTNPAVSLTPFSDMGLPHLTIRRVA